VTYPGASPQEVEEGIVLKIRRTILKGLEKGRPDGLLPLLGKNSGINKMVEESEKGWGYRLLWLLESKKCVDQSFPSFPTGMEALVVSKLETVRDRPLVLPLSGESISLVRLKADR